MSRGPLLAQAAAEAQYSILGALLVDPDCVGEVLLSLSDRDFLEPSYRLVYQAIRKLYNAGKVTDPLSVNDALGVESRQLLIDCINLTPTSANVMEWVKILRRRALQFRLAALGDRLSDAVDLDEALGVVDEINSAACQKQGVKITTMKQAYEEFCTRHGEEQKPPYLTWGFQKVDDAVYVEPGDMIVMGGYPSAGKTALALQFCKHIAKTKRVGYFYLENNDRKLFDRLVSSTTFVSFSRIKKHEMQECDFSTIAAMRVSLTEPQLELVDASAMTVADIRSTALSMHYDLVVVDYLQKIRGDRSRRNMSDFERVTQISSDLQELGRELKVTVLALSQLSRPETIKQGEMVAPTMSSLRQSGQLEQDADVVFLVYRTDSQTQERRFKIAKNKEGESGLVVDMMFDGDTQTFCEMAAETGQSLQTLRKLQDVGKAAKARNHAQGQQSFWGDGTGWKRVPDSPDNPFKEEENH